VSKLLILFSLIIIENVKAVLHQSEGGDKDMAKNTGNGYRRGAVDKRSQTYNPVTEQWVKRDAETGRFMDVKQNREPFKGVRKED
jgi:hypothetical protein